MERARELIGYIPDNTNAFICIDCIDEAGIDLAHIGAEENVAVLATDDWKNDVGLCCKCQRMPEDIVPDTQRRRR